MLQLIVFELDDDGRGVMAEKLKIYDNGEVYNVEARIEQF